MSPTPNHYLRHESLTIYTVGHSNHSPDTFLALLRRHGIGHVADVRTRPYSRWPWFGRERLQAMLARVGIGYTVLGEALGGRPAAHNLYDAQGKPDYAAMASLPLFHAGLDALLALADAPTSVAILCSEGDPRLCHREHLIAMALRPLGVTVRHILRDGTLDATAPPTADDATQMSLDL